MPGGHARVIGLGGSLRSPSRSLSALVVAMGAAEQAGATVRVFDLRPLDLPYYVPGQAPSARAEELLDATYEADGMIWSSPMYHGSISGAFKNALDWFELLRERDPPYLTDKVVGLISAAGGAQGLQAVNTMEYVVRALRGFAIPMVVPIAARNAFDAEGNVVDERVRDQLRHLGEEVAAICLRRRPRTGGSSMSTERKQDG
jgi:FMN reductase